MHFKLIIAFACEENSPVIMEAAREAGVMGSTLISHARGEGVKPKKTFFGLSLESHRDVLLFLVEEHLARTVLETIEQVGKFNKKERGIAFQIDVEDAVGISHQMKALSSIVEKEI